MSMITHLIIARLAEHLNRELVTRVPSSSPTRASLVKAYRYQISPLQYPIHAWITGGEDSDPLSRDGRVTAHEMERLGIYIPAGEVGGGHAWYRRGIIGVGCYFTMARYSEMDAANYAWTFLGRVLYQTERVTVADLKDEFGESAHSVAVYASNFVEGGGPDDQYIWRGSVYWQALTFRPL